MDASSRISLARHNRTPPLYSAAKYAPSGENATLVILSPSRDIRRASPISPWASVSTLCSHSAPPDSVAMYLPSGLKVTLLTSSGWVADFLNGRGVILIPSTRLL